MRNIKRTVLVLIVASFFASNLEALQRNVRFWAGKRDTQWEGLDRLCNFYKRNVGRGKICYVEAGYWFNEESWDQGDNALKPLEQERDRLITTWLEVCPTANPHTFRHVVFTKFPESLGEEPVSMEVDCWRE